MGATTIRDNNPLLYRIRMMLRRSRIDPARRRYLHPYDNRLLSYDFRFSATYNTTINNTHIINAYLGMKPTRAIVRKRGFRGWGLQYDSGEIPFYDLSSSSRRTRRITRPITKWATPTTTNVAFFFNEPTSYSGPLYA